MKKELLISLALFFCALAYAQEYQLKTFSDNFNTEVKCNKSTLKTPGEVYWSEDFNGTEWAGTVQEWGYGYALNTEAILPIHENGGTWTFTDLLNKEYYWHWSDVGPRGAFVKGADGDCHTPDNDVLADLPEGTSLENGFLIFEADYFNSTENCVLSSGFVPHESYVEFGPIDFTGKPGAIFNMKTLYVLCCQSVFQPTLQLRFKNGSTGDWGKPYQINQNTEPNKITNFNDRDCYLNVSQDIYEKTDIYFRIEFTGSSHYYAIIDDIKFIEPEQNDLVIKDWWCDYMYDAEAEDYLVSQFPKYNFWGGYTQIPVDYVSKFVDFRAAVQNNGTINAENVVLSAAIFKDNVLDYSVSNDAQSIPKFEWDTLRINANYTPDTLGHYQVSLTVAMDATDAIPEDNTWINYEFEVVPNNYSRVYHSNAANFYGAGPHDWVHGGNDGDCVAQLYSFDENRTDSVHLKSVNVFVDYYNDTNDSDEIVAIEAGEFGMIGRVWIDDGNGNAIETGISSEFYTLTLSDAGTWVSLKFIDDGTLIVDANLNYIVGVETYTGNNDLHFKVGAEKTFKTPEGLGLCYLVSNDTWTVTNSNYAIDLSIEPISQQQVTLTFNYALSNAENFSVNEDSIFVTGSFNNWLKPGEEGSTLLTDEDGDMIYTASIKVGVNQTIEYKYFKNAGWQGGEWQGDPNRIVTIETEDVTVNDIGDWHNHLASLTFNVDMSDVEDFTLGVDEVYVSGTFNDWAEPGLEGSLLLADDDGDMIYSGVVEVEWNQTIEYKYFKNTGWDDEEWVGDPLRSVVIYESDVVVNDEFGYGSDEWPSQVTLTFNVDMTDPYQEFDPQIDSVYVTGSFTGWAQPGFEGSLRLNDVDGDMIFTVSVPVDTYQTIEYKYFLNAGWDNGEWAGGPNRFFEIYESAVEVHDIFGAHGDDIDPEPWIVQITLNVDMNHVYGFSNEKDTVYLSGSFNSWAEPGTDSTHILTDPDGDLIYTDSVYAWSNQKEIYYRYYLNAGWDGAEWQGDSSRVVYLYGSDLIVNDYWGTTHLNPYVALVNPEIYPNPFAEELHFKDLDIIEKASICNLMGQVIKTVQVNGDFSINTSNYKPGVYLVNLMDKSGKSKVYKLVKE